MSGILVMSMILSVIGGELPHTSDTYLFYPRELGVTQPEIVSGIYALWVCAAQNADSFVEAQGVRHELKPGRTKDRNPSLRGSARAYRPSRCSRGCDNRRLARR